MTPIKIFISHAAKDEDLATALVDLLNNCLDLEDVDVRCTSVAGHKLPVGVDAAQAIKQDLSDTGVVIALLTPNAITSSWVLFELGAAWGADKRILPLLAEGLAFSSLPGPIAGRHAVKVTDEDDIVQFVQELATAIGASLRQMPKITASVGRFVRNP